MKTIILTLIALSIFAGCTAKEFNANVDSITSDISNTLEDGKDKSAD